MLHFKMPHAGSRKDKPNLKVSVSSVGRLGDATTLHRPQAQATNKKFHFPYRPRGQTALCWAAILCGVARGQKVSCSLDIQVISMRRENLVGTGKGNAL